MQLEQPFLSWHDGDQDGLRFSIPRARSALIAYELERVPNFGEPRFFNLGQSLEDRRAEIVRRQLQMLRQLHGLGEQSALSLRLIKEDSQIRLLVIVRTQPPDHASVEQAARRIAGSFPPEYRLKRLDDADVKATVLDTDLLDSIRFIDVIIKSEEKHRANTWPYFYVSSLWQGQSTNDLETLCRALVRFEGHAVVDMTLLPTNFGRQERGWVDQCLKVMRQALNGERLVNREDNRVLKTFDPLPGLRVPLDNYEDLMKRYDQSRLFLFSFRVLGSHDPSSITQALITSATRSRYGVLRLLSGRDGFAEELRAFAGVTINPRSRADMWHSSNELPYRAQRLHRLADVEEIAPFWRLPVPVRPGFPGFELDIGDDRGRPDGGGQRSQHINLGRFADDVAEIDSLARFDMQGLAKHGLIVGVPGSGKTTTMFHILNQLWGARIPFIVLEPAKTEYRALLTTQAFTDSMLVFTLGDERSSPFRFNPFEVPTGVPLESHIARLNACFTGAFNLFDPLPMLLDKAIRQTYEVFGWYDDSIGGEVGVETPKLSELCDQAEQVIMSSGYSDKLRDDFNAALLQRLESLRRGSKGRMLDSRQTIPLDELMNRPVILELDALNENEKALMMMFLLSLVYEYAKSTRRSGSPLRHVLIVEEAHNLIGRGDQGGSEFRANPKDLAIRMFTRMLAEMRALGQGILIADQLPTALAPEAVKQTNLKVLMRMTARDDREEIGNTMDLDEPSLKAVTRFKSGQALVYLEEWDRVRQVQMPNFKKQHNVEEPPNDNELGELMAGYEEQHQSLYRPFSECAVGCRICNRRVRSQAERLVSSMLQRGSGNIALAVRDDVPQFSTLCRTFKAKALAGALALKKRHGAVEPILPFCSYVHFINEADDLLQACFREQNGCECAASGGHSDWLTTLLELGARIADNPHP